MHEYNAGVGSGKLLEEAGATHVLCLIHEANAAALNSRCAGAEEHILSVGKRITITNLVEKNVATDNDDEIKEFVKSELEKEASIDAILCGGGVLVDPVRRALLELGKDPAAFYAGSFDNNEILAQAINAKEYFLFGVDQQQYMQGYMGVLSAFIYATTNQRLATHVIESGPYFIRSAEPSKEECISMDWMSPPGDPIIGERLKPTRDAEMTKGFPVCEYTGNCAADSQYFDLEDARCKPCPAGTFKNASLISCMACAPGRSTNGETGNTECTDCSAGKYASTNSTANCNFCERGSYGEEKRMTACKLCVAPLTTEFIAQTSNSSCVCKEDFFMDVGMCNPCKTGMTCAVGSNMKNWPNGPGPFPLIEQGYMALYEDPLSVYMCSGPVAEEICPAQTKDMPFTCANGRSGIGCGICPEGMMSEGAECVDCEGSLVLVLVLIAIVMLAAPVGFYYVANDPLTTNATTLLGGSIAVGLIITVVQVLGTFGQLSVLWPQRYNEMLSGAQVFLFEPSSLKMECFVGRAPYDLYFLRFISPFVAGSVFLLYHVITQAGLCVRPWNINKTLNSMGHALQTIFIALVGIAVVPMQCFSHPNGDKSVKQFPNVICTEDEHTQLLVLGILLLGLIVAPYFALNLFATVRAPSWDPVSSAKNALETAPSGMLRFRYLFYRFRPDVWWWGNLVNTRQLMLAFAPMIEPDDPGVQVIYVLGILSAYLILVSLFKPWKAFELNAMEIISLFCLSLVISNVGSFMPPSKFSYAHEVSIWVFFSFCCLFNVGVLLLAIFGVAFKGIRGGFGIRYPVFKTQEALAKEFRSLCEVALCLNPEVVVNIMKEMSDFDRLAIDSTISACVKAGMYEGKKPNSLKRIWSMDSMNSTSSAGDIKEQIVEGKQRASFKAGDEPNMQQPEVEV
jgi:hypothetical protein